MTDFDPPIERYDELLQELSTTRPRIASALHRAHDNRQKHLQRWLSGLRLDGLEEFLGFLESVEAAMAEQPELCRIAFLMARARADYETAIEAALSGMRDVVFDSMRDVMEIEYLLKDFTHHAQHIDEWLRKPPGDSSNKFSAGKMREREAQRLGVKPTELPSKRDYRGHSAFLHVNATQNPLGGKGILVNGRSILDHLLEDSPFWEMYRHGSSLILTLLDLFSVYECERNDELFDTVKMASFISANSQVEDTERWCLSNRSVLREILRKM